MRCFVWIVLLNLGCFGYGQTTWQQLKFGMDKQQVRDALKQKNFTVQENEDSTLTALPDFEVATDSAYLSSELKPGVASAPMFFTPKMVFGQQGNLQAIKLDLDQEKAFQTTPALNSMAPLLTMIAGTSIYEQLTGKYGAPATQSGPCDRVPLADLVVSFQQCRATWSDSGQTISLVWIYNSARRALTTFRITYKASASSGL